MIDKTIHVYYLNKLHDPLKRVIQLKIHVNNLFNYHIMDWREIKQVWITFSGGIVMYCNIQKMIYTFVAYNHEHCSHFFSFLGRSKPIVKGTPK